MHNPVNAQTARTNWDDLRYVLAVAETGSVSAAARRLGVNHATVLRRIAAFEEAQGCVLFERSAQGYAIAPDRLRIIEAAREAAAAIEAVGRMMRGREPQYDGVVRVTSTDSLCVAVLPGIVADLQRESRGLRIELISTNAQIDLSRLGADITVRPAPRLPDELVGEQAGLLEIGLFCAPGQQDAPFLALRGRLARMNLADQIDPEGAGADSFVVLRELVAQGVGRSVLPLCLGLGDPRLIRLPDPQVWQPVPIWVASHRDLADAPRLRGLRRRMVDALGDRMARLADQGV